MKKSAIIVFVLSFLFFVSSCSRGSPAPTYDELDELNLALQEELDESNGKYEDLQGEYAGLDDEYSSLYSDYLDALEYKKKYESLQQKVNNLYEYYFDDACSFFDREAGSSFSKAYDSFYEGMDYLSSIADL